MSKEAQSDCQDTSLSESWATLSDADYSFDEDLQSEITDAASLIDNSGAEDVHNMVDQTSDTASQDAYRDENISEERHSQHISVESTISVATQSASAFRTSPLTEPIKLQPRESQIETEWSEVTRVIHSFGGKEANEIMGSTTSAEVDAPYVSRVCMTICKSMYRLDRPFQLLYVGNASARAEILAKIEKVFMSGLEPQQSQYRSDSSQHQPSEVSDPLLNQSDSIKNHKHIIVNDCTTAASIRHEQAPDQIFLSFKNGSLYSSRWVGNTYEISSASEWSAPDLAIFLLAQEDHPVLKQRQQLAHVFASRHQIPSLVICESPCYEPCFGDFPIDPRTPHLRIEPKGDGPAQPLGSLPIDMKTFLCLDSEQLNKNLAYLINGAGSEITSNIIGNPSAPSHASPHESPANRRNASGQNPSKPATLYSWCSDNPLLAIIVLVVGGLISLVVGLVAYKVTLTLFMYLLSGSGEVSDLSPAITWTLEPPSAAITLERTPSVVQTAGIAVVTQDNAVSKSLAIMDAPSDLARLITSKSVQSTNKSDNFQVHGIGDSHIIVKTPRGFKIMDKSAPFEVVVARGRHVLDSCISKLFDGVYTVGLDRREAYGLLNVTIRRPKSSTLDEHQVDFGPKWLKVACWKKAAQVASEQLRTDLDTAQLSFLRLYSQFLEDMHFKAKDLSRRVAWQARKFSQPSRLFVNSTAELLRAKSDKLRNATYHERQEAYEVLSKRVNVGFRALLRHAHTANERGRTVLENILKWAGQTAEQIQQSSPHINVVDVQDKMQEWVRSERLAVAQERAKWIAKGTLGSWRQRRVTRRARRTGSVKKGIGCNR